MSSLTQQALKQCPDSKIILSGYSQGGFVVHVAAQNLSATPPLGGKRVFKSQDPKKNVD